MATSSPHERVALIHGTQGRFLDNKQNSVEANIDYSRRVRSYHVGPIPFKLLKAVFFDEIEVHKPAPKVDWAQVPKVKLEVHMYDLFIQAMLDCILLRKNVEIIVSADRHSSTSHLRPDVGVRILPGKTISRQWRKRELLAREAFEFTKEALAIEFKLSKDADPFLDNFDHPKSPFERDSDVPRKTRGQLARYADAQLCQQHRRFIWQVLICSNIARILRWDRTGALVSEGFDYIKTDYLAEFLWYFFHMTPVQQGWDDSVQLVRGVRLPKLFYSAVEQFITQASKKIRNGPSFVCAALDQTYPIHKVTVEDRYTGQAFYFLIGRAFYTTHGPLGRMTRVYLAYDLQSKDVKLLKDSWAMDDENLIPEHDAYDLLRAAGVPSLLPINCGGDVKTDGTVQRTEIQTYAAKPYPWRAPCGSYFRTLRHCRLVQDVAYPITCLRSSREATIVFCDIAKCIKSAYEDAKILNRDISLGNILFMLTDAAPGIVGILNDWDHSTKIDKAVDQLLPFRSATFQCLSIALLKNPRKVHGLTDDFESLFWAFVYLALHFISHSDRSVLLNNAVFGPGLERVFSGEVTKIDAKGKTELLFDGILNDFPFVCQPFKRLISRLALSLHTLYSLESLAKASATARTGYEEAQRQVSDPDWWIAGFQEALAEKGWKDNDMVDDMFPPLSTVEVQKEVDAFATTLYDSSHLTATKVQTLSQASLDCMRAPALQATIGVKRPLEQSLQASRIARDVSSTAAVGRKKPRTVKENAASDPPKEDGVKKSLPTPRRSRRKLSTTRAL